MNKASKVRAICEKRNLYKNKSGTFFQFLPNDIMDQILTSTIHKEIIKGVELVLYNPLG